MRLESYLGEMKGIDYPKRKSNSEAEWRQFIIALVKYTKARYGNSEFTRTDGMEFKATGQKVLKKMHDEGVIEVEMEEITKTGQPIKGKFGKLVSWGGIESYTEIRIKPGKKFPQ